MSKRVRFIWEREDTVRVIDLLKKHEILWNTNHKQFHNNDLREHAYYDILNHLRDILPEDATIQDIRAKVSCIRTQHNRVMIQHQKTGKPVTYWCYEQLHFLRGEDSPPPEKRACLDGDPLGDRSDESEENSKGRLSWTHHNTLILLEKYKMYRCLWDPLDKYYDIPKVCEKVYENISKSLTPRMHVKDVKAKIGYLRYMYKKKLQKPASKQPGFEPVWWFNHMHFLKPIVENEDADGDCSEFSSDENDDYETTADDINEQNSEITLSTPNMIEEINLNTVDEDYNACESLGKQVDETLKQLKNEKIKGDLVDCTRKLLQQAASIDKSIFRPVDIVKEFQERQNAEYTDQTFDAQQTFEVKLTFDTQADNMCILKSISELPYLKQIQLSGNNLAKAARKNTLR